MEYILQREARPGQVAQVVFRNQRHHWGFIPEKTVLIAGSPEAGQQLFEEITHLKGFQADRILYVLDTGSPMALAGGGFDACLSAEGFESPSGMDCWNMDDIAAFYALPRREVLEQPRVATATDERLVVQLPSLTEDTLLFLSRQRFRDWFAYGDGDRLQVFKAAAGLTAIRVPVGVERVVYKYEVPWVERWARLFSLASFCGALLWWRLRR